MIKFIAVFVFSCALTTMAFGDALDSWTPIVQSTNGIYSKIIFANGQFVAISDYDVFVPMVGWTSGGFVSASSDGVHWVHLHTRDIPSGVAFGNGIFARCGWDPSSDGDSGFTFCASNAVSSDNTNLNLYFPSNIFSGLYSLTFGSNSTAKGLFVSVGHFYYNDVDTIITSSDGVNWTSQNSKVTNEFLEDIAFGNNFFVAVGYTNYLGFFPPGTTSASLLRSSDGTNWAHLSTNMTHIVSRAGAINFVNGLFYVETYYPTTNVYVGATTSYVLTNTPYPSLWVPIGSPSGTYVSINSGSNIYTSTNGFNWTLRNTGITNTLNCIAYGGGRFVIGCSDGTLLLSGSTAPSIASHITANGAVQLTLNSGLVSQCTIPASSDLHNWSNIVTLTNLQMASQFLDTVNTNLAVRYYRTVSQ